MKKEKVLSALMAATMACSMATPAFATQAPIAMDEQSTHSEAITNEYLAMKEMSEESNDELMAVGYSVQEVSEIRNYKDLYDEHILNLAKLDEDKLAAFGYREEQIDVIKNFEPSTATEEDRSLISAHCITTSTISNYTGKTATITSTFNWDGVPSFKFTDCFVTSWNNWQIDSKVSSPITYVNVNDPSKTYKRNTQSWKDSDTGLTSYGIGISFPVSQDDNYYYADSGRCTFRVKSASIQNIETASRYGHTQIAPSISFSLPGGVAISFAPGIVSEGEGHDSVDYE